MQTIECFVKDILKRILFRLFGFSVKQNRLSVRKTLLFNFCAFGWRGICKIPVFVYGNTELYKIGKINIHCEMSRGIVCIGRNNYKSQGVTRFCNSGIIDICGPVRIEGATIVENFGTIKLDGDNLISDGSMILVRSELQMGKHSRLGFHGLIMDSDDHFTFDVNSRKIYRNSKPIKIGAFNWFGNSTFIKKGVVTPDYLIVASANSVLAKDYSSVPPYSVLGGVPAKIIKSGIRTVFDTHKEWDVINFFKKNPEAESFDIAADIDLDEFCADTKKGL